MILKAGDFIPARDLQVLKEIDFDEACRRSLTIKGTFYVKEEEVKERNSKSEW